MENIAKPGSLMNAVEAFARVTTFRPSRIVDDAK